MALSVEVRQPTQTPNAKKSPRRALFHQLWIKLDHEAWVTELVKVR